MSGPDVVFTAVGGFGEGGVAYYRTAWDQNPTHTWTGSEYTWAGGALTEYAASSAGGWYFHVQGYNSAGVPNGTLDIGPFYYDDSAPTSLVVTDDGAYTLNRTQFHAAWSAADPESGIAGYRYCVGSTPGGADLVGWTDTGSTSIVATVPEQPYGGRCYFTVKAQNGAGAWSSPASSDGITVARPVASIAEARMLPDGEAIAFTAAKTVTAAFADFLYIEESDRTSGIRVDASGGVPGKLASVAGILGQNGAERSLTLAEISVGAPSTIPSPLAMNCRAIGGASFGDNPGVTGGTGLNNLGLLIRAAGVVAGATSGTFVLEDGSGASVKVYSSKAVADGQYVAVTGVSAAEVSGSDRIRVIRTRSETDVQILR